MLRQIATYFLFGYFKYFTLNKLDAYMKEIYYHHR